MDTYSHNSSSKTMKWIVEYFDVFVQMEIVKIVKLSQKFIFHLHITSNLSIDAAMTTEFTSLLF